MRNIKKKYIIISSILILFFIVITYLVLTNKMEKIDDSIYKSIFSIRNNFFDNFFKTITKFGNTLFILCIVIILLLKIDSKNRNILGGNVIVTVVANQLLKNIIRRERPSHLRLIKQGGFSFPSGHAMISIAIYGFLIYYINQKIKNK